MVFNVMPIKHCVTGCESGNRGRIEMQIKAGTEDQFTDLLTKIRFEAYRTTMRARVKTRETSRRSGRYVTGDRKAKAQNHEGD